MFMLSFTFTMAKRDTLAKIQTTPSTLTAAFELTPSILSPSTARNKHGSTLQIALSTRARSQTKPIETGEESERSS